MRLQFLPLQATPLELKRLWSSLSPVANFFLLYGFDGQLFEKGKINESDFVLIDQALKPRPCRPLLLSQLLAKVNS